MADTIYAKASPTTGGFTPHPEGQYALQCVDVIDLGERVTQFQQNPPKLTHKMYLVFRSAELNDEGEYYEVSKEFTVSMHEKAKLREFLGQWRGKSYSDAEAEGEGAPLHKLEGVYALASIEQKKSTTSDRVYANIASIAPLPKAMPKPNTGKYERPAYWAEKKAAYAAEAALKFPDKPVRGVSETPAALDDADDSDLPF